MKFFNKYNIASLVLLLLFVVAQFVPFTHTTKLVSEVEDAGKTWAELPVGIAGKDRGTWPSEIKYGEFKDWEPEVQKKYPLYGEKNVSIFSYVWNPAGALYGKKVNAFVFAQVAFLAFALAAFLIKNYMAKAVFAFIFALSNFLSTVLMFLLKASGDLTPYLGVPIFSLVIGLAAVALGIYFIPEYFREKARNEEIRKSI